MSKVIRNQVLKEIGVEIIAKSKQFFAKFHRISVLVHMGMWLSGRAFALHVKGPGFDPRHLQFLHNHTSLKVKPSTIYE